MQVLQVEWQGSQELAGLVVAGLSYKITTAKPSSQIQDPINTSDNVA